jgi:hypothetical protein
MPDTFLAYTPLPPSKDYILLKSILGAGTCRQMANLTIIFSFYALCAMKALKYKFQLSRWDKEGEQGGGGKKKQIPIEIMTEFNTNNSHPYIHFLKGW